MESSSFLPENVSLSTSCTLYIFCPVRPVCNTGMKVFIGKTQFIEYSYLNFIRFKNFYEYYNNIGWIYIWRKNASFYLTTCLDINIKILNIKINKSIHSSIYSCFYLDNSFIHSFIHYIIPSLKECITEFLGLKFVSNNSNCN